MAVSRLSIAYRCLTPVIAASLLAGVSLDAEAYGSKGRLRLQTGKTLSAFQVTYETSVSSVWTPQSSQLFNLGKGCTVALAPSPALATLSAFGPRSTTTAGSLGYIATSLGVFDGPQGTGCGRVSFDKTEALAMGLGTGLATVAAGANAFDRLEIDLEVKGDVELLVQVIFEDRVTEYTLLAGAAKVGSTADPPGKVLTPDDTVYKCNASSDSGADSGPSDNCRLIIEDVGQSAKFTPQSGEVSLEGGGDYASPALHGTEIYLTQADGILDCGDSISTSNTAMSCTVNRLDPSNGTRSCTPIPYVFRTNGGTCTLTADPQGQQLVANLFVSYQPENAPASTIEQLAAASAWPIIGLSKVRFATDTTNTVFDIPACLGVTVSDGFSGPAPISEIATNGSTLDRVPATKPSIEFACAFQRTETFQTDPSTDQLKLYIDEGIQFWGDISFSRQ